MTSDLLDLCASHRPSPVPESEVTYFTDDHILAALMGETVRVRGFHLGFELRYVADDARNPFRVVMTSLAFGHELGELTCNEDALRLTRIV